MQMSSNNDVASKIVGGVMFGLTLTGSMFTGIDNANAKSGQSPSQGFFGFGDTSMSSPYAGTPTYSPYSPYSAASEKSLYKAKGADEIKFYEGKFTEARKRMDKIDGYLQKKQWENVRSELTRQMYDLRKSTNILVGNSPAGKAKAEKLYQDMENLTVSSRRKQGDVAAASLKAVKADFDEIIADVGK
jgi:hypothetical protein